MSFKYCSSNWPFNIPNLLKIGNVTKDIRVEASLSDAFEFKTVYRTGNTLADVLSKQLFAFQMKSYSLIIFRSSFISEEFKVSILFFYLCIAYYKRK